MDWLENGQISFSFQQQPCFKKEVRSGVMIHYAATICHPGLVNYLYKRKISIATAMLYCKEVHYLFKGRKYFAIGLKNDSGGWEFRNKYYKNSSSPKDITYIKNGNRRLIVTEGMFDMLSLLERDKNLMEKNDLLILNSLAFVEKIPGVIKRYQSIALYLDNDKAGKSATKLLMEQSPKCRDMSNLYKDFKDVNAWLMSKKL